MKKILLFLILTFFALPLLAQDDSTISDKEEVLIPKIEKIGVFGGPSIKIAQLYNAVGLFMGGQGCAILNNSFIIGGGGYGLVTNVKASNLFEPKLQMKMNYGGLILGYINKSNDAIHYNFQTLIGGGDVSWSDKNNWLIFKDWNDESDKFGHDSYFVIEPGVGVEMRLTKFFEMDFGVSYLFAFDVNSRITLTGDNSQNIIKTLRNKDLSGMSGTLKFIFVLPDVMMHSDLINDIIEDILN
jgi:hypothetical protein